MLTNLLYLLTAVVFTFILYPFWISFVYRHQLGEAIRTDGPEAHIIKRGTPTMGGLVFIFTLAVITFSFNQSRTQTLFPIFVASLAGLLGLWEDFVKVYRKKGVNVYDLQQVKVILRGLGVFRSLPGVTLLNTKFRYITDLLGSSKGSGVESSSKFLAELGLASFVAYWTYFKLGWDYFWLPLIGNVSVGVLYPLVIFFGFLLVLNCVAFTDGLDGLAGGLAIIALSAYWVIASSLGYNSLATYCATFIGVLLPFLYFNVYPARIFMGDVGSHTLGASLAILSIVMHREFALLVLLGVFLVDGISSPLQQFSVRFTGKRLFRMAPLHHHFELMGWPETKVTLRFWLFGVFLAFVGIFVALL